MSVDFYDELGIDSNATSTHIRAAYKRLALIWHPDRNKTSGAEEKFKAVKQAYDTLIDEKQRHEYDLQRPLPAQPEKTWFQTNSQPNSDTFNLHPIDPFLASPIDPFDILNDIQFFQEPDFISNMMNSPGYRHLYTHLFSTMNNNTSNNNSNNRNIFSSSPIFLNNDRLFRPGNKHRHKHHHHHRSSSKRSSMSSSSSSAYGGVSVVHSTMPSDRFLNELIDLYEQQTRSNTQSFIDNETFFAEMTNCQKCHKKFLGDRHRLIEHEQHCRRSRSSVRSTVLRA